MPPPINSRHSKQNSAAAADDPGDYYPQVTIGMTGFATDPAVAVAPTTYWQFSKSCQFESGAGASQAFASNRIPGAAACPIQSRRPQCPSPDGSPYTTSNQDFTLVPLSEYGRESAEPNQSVAASRDDDLSWVGSGRMPTQGQWSYLLQPSVPYDMVQGAKVVLQPHPSIISPHFPGPAPTFEGGFVDPRLLIIPSHPPQEISSPIYNPSPTSTSVDLETSPSMSPSTTVASPHNSPIVAYGCPDPPAVTGAVSHKPYKDQLHIRPPRYMPASPVEGSSSTWKNLCRCPLKVNYERKHWTRTCPYNPNRKKHSCPNCGEPFSRKDNMTRHMKQGCDPKSAV